MYFTIIMFFYGGNKINKRTFWCQETTRMKSPVFSIVHEMTSSHCRTLLPFSMAGCTCNIPVRMDTYEPPHDKTNKMTVRPANTQISLGIRQVWSEFALCIAKGPSFLHGGCPGWSESSLGAHAICWFCHEAAHIDLHSSSSLGECRWKYFSWQ